MPSSTAPIAVGVLFSETGVTALVERTQRHATRVAIEEINAAGGVLGRPLEAVAPDPASDPQRYQAEAARLMAAGVSTVFGCYMSSTRRSVLPVIERHDALLFYPTLYEGFEFSRNCVYSGAAPNQNSLWLAEYMLLNHGTRFYFVGSNYVFPYESNRIMRDLIQNGGGTVVEERYIPLQAGDAEIAPVIEDIRRHAPAVVFSTIVGDAAVRFHRAYDRAGFDRAAMPICSLTTGEPELQAMGPAAAEGHVTCAPYFSTVDRAENRRFVAAYRRQAGPDAPISACTEAAYFQVKMFAEAAARAGTTERGALLSVLPTFTFEAPQGPVRLHGETHHTYLWPRIGVAASDGSFRIVQTASAPVEPDPYMIAPELPDWGRRAAGG
jgi:branched-chain amino acid transport system substrate-binding protein